MLAAINDIISRCRYCVWLTWKRIVHRPALSILLALLVVYIIASIVIMSYEGTGFGQAALKAFPAFFGELGEIETPYLAVEISIVIGILASVTFIVIITAKITSVLIEFLRRGGSMAKKVNFTGHTIICGWNFQGERVVKDLLAADSHNRGIVVLTDSEERPISDERIEFIKGDPANDDDLERAGIRKAESVIILTDFAMDANAADAQAIMIALAVEDLNRDVHSCVQIMNSVNAVHLRHAHADEIICLDQMGGSLAVFGALHHGSSMVISELLTFDKGSEIYRYEGNLSDKIVAKEYTDVAKALAEQHMVLLGVETEYTEETKTMESQDVLHQVPEKNRVIIVNPQAPFVFHSDDALFIASESKPENL